MKRGETKKEYLLAEEQSCGSSGEKNLNTLQFYICHIGATDKPIQLPNSGRDESILNYYEISCVLSRRL